jgi:hypothetical protein
MNLEEYKQSMKALEAVFTKEKNDLIRSYVKSSAKYSIGDIIQDKYGGKIIQVLVVRPQINHEDIPYPVYHGVVLTKALKPKKIPRLDDIYGDDRAILVKKASEEII